METMTKTINLTKVGNTIHDDDIKAIELIFESNNLINLECLGGGAFGDVYKYTSLLDGKSYAIKIGRHNEEYSNDIDILLVLRKLDNFVKIHAYDKNVNNSGKFIMIVDFIDGKTIYQHETSGFNVEIDDGFIAYFERTLDILAEKQINICDLHWSNIMINNNLPIIVDYGALSYDQHKDKDILRVSYGYRDAMNTVKSFYDNYQSNKPYRKQNIA